VRYLPASARLEELPIHPVSDWLLRYSSRSLGAEGLLERLCVLLRDNDVPISRASLNVHTLHPEIFVRNIVWSVERGISSETISHFDLLLPIFKDSPVALIYGGAGPIRRVLAGPHAELDFPICRDLAAEGATDYLILPLDFSDSRRTYVSFCTNTDGGFSSDNVAALIEIAPYLAVRMELTSSYFATSSLLQLYLGRNAARRVLAGHFKRGSAAPLEGAIWYSDLRGFTELSEQQSANQVMEMLDGYFEFVADAIRDAGGEILKFIGNGVLAVFDFAESDQASACRQAVRAALAALDAAEAWNSQRSPDADLLKMGVALHAGSVLHGNVGSRERFDFTVVGPAMTEVSRLEPLCLTIGVPLVMSRRFVELYEDTELVGMGRFVLRGVRQPQEIYSLRSLLPRVRRAADSHA